MADELVIQRVMWLEQFTKSIITLRRVLGGGEGYNVSLQTTAKVPPDYKRTTYHRTLLEAAGRVIWLQLNTVHGRWKEVTEARLEEVKP